MKNKNRQKQFIPSEALKLVNFADYLISSRRVTVENIKTKGRS